jgi:hypothetical protein
MRPERGSEARYEGCEGSRTQETFVAWWKRNCQHCSVRL